MFVSVDGKAKKVTDIFAGGTDGKAHRVTEMFGSVDGIAKLLFTTTKETNAFEQFTWADIKQLANEGKLLEHFNKYDRVTIKLKEPLRNDNFKIGSLIVPQIQNEMILHIVELTETRMRLMSPRVSAIGTAVSSIPRKKGNLTEDDKRYLFANDWNSGSSYALNEVGNAWGLTPIYDALKTIENVLPDDFRDVLSVCTRPLISYTKNAISGGIKKEYDEDMRIRQISDNVFRKSLDTSNSDIYYPIINESYYPTLVGEYLRYVYIPEENDSYEQRRKLVSNQFAGFKLMNHTLKKATDGNWIRQSSCNAPHISCYFSKGITTSEEYSSYNSSDAGKITTDYQENLPASCNVVFPEMIIEADY